MTDRKKRLKRILIPIAVICVIAALAAVWFIIHSQNGKITSQREDLIDPIKENVVFADKFPESAAEAYALISQKTYALRMENRYRITGTQSLQLTDVRSENADKVKAGSKSTASAVVSSANKTLNDFGVAYGEETAAVIPDVSAFGEPQDYTAQCTQDGVFLLELKYTGAAGLDVANAYSETASVALNAAAAAESISLSQFAPAETVIFAEIDGYHGLLTKLTLTQKYTCRMELNQPVIASFAYDASFDIKREGVYFESKSVSLRAGKHAQLKFFKNLPENITDDQYTVEFRSSDDRVLTVDENGRIHALSAAPDSVTVTVMLTYNETHRMLYDLCEVTVTE